MRQSASDKVLEYIQERIKAGEWQAGTKISTESQLQEETGFGKASVRAAVEKLVAMGILTKRQGDGTYVNDLSAGTLINQLMPGFVFNAYDPADMLEFRAVMEPACVKMLILHYDEAIYRQLKKILDDMRMHEHDREKDDFYKADRDFHLVIARGSCNPIMIKIAEIFDDVMTQYHYTANRTIGSRTGVAEHEAVLNAIYARDSELAALLLKRHIQRSQKDMMEYMEAI